MVAVTCHHKLAVGSSPILILNRWRACLNVSSWTLSGMAQQNKAHRHCEKRNTKDILCTIRAVGNPTNSHLHHASKHKFIACREVILWHRHLIWCHGGFLWHWHSIWCHGALLLVWRHDSSFGWRRSRVWFLDWTARIFWFKCYNHIQSQHLLCQGSVLLVEQQCALRKSHLDFSFWKRVL